MLGTGFMGDWGELSPHTNLGASPKPYAIMRSDSSLIRLFFFWTRYSSWFVHRVCWSAGLSAGQGNGERGADPHHRVTVLHLPWPYHSHPGVTSPA